MVARVRGDGLGGQGGRIGRGTGRFGLSGVSPSTRLVSVSPDIHRDCGIAALVSNGLFLQDT